MIRTSCRIPGVLFVVSASLALFAVLVTPARATTPVSPGVNLSQLVAEVQTLQNQVQSLQNTVNSQAAAITTLQNEINNLPTNAALQTEVAALQAKTAPISIANGVGTNTEMVITGVNVHIVNGLGATNGNPGDPFNFLTNTAVNGLGNLIIGYNQSGVGHALGPDVRTGSHNLILGDANNYSSFGGFVGGQFNLISFSYGSVFDGSSNIASGLLSAVIGGVANTASSESAVVAGGIENLASGTDSVVTGGQEDTASGFTSVVTAGAHNTATEVGTEVTGGLGNTNSIAFTIAP